MVDPKDEDGPNSTWLDAGSEEVQVMVAPLVVGVDEREVMLREAGE